jgi:hypothetical protein
MRLRKNMKRTAAAVLALSMAVSAVAAPASAAYICDVSKGDVVVSVDKDGTQSITVGGAKVEKTEDDTDDIIITGDNTKPTESLNAEEENTSEAEKSGENASEVEKSGETKTEGEGKTQNSAAENKEQAEEPGSLELLAPEDEQKETDQKKDEQKPAETQETEQDKKTEKTSDQVIEYGQYDPEAQQEATKPAAKPVVKQETQEKKAAEEKTYGDTNAPTTLSEKAQAAANNVVKIINNSAETLKVFLKNLKVDAGNTNKSAVRIEGDGDVTLELDGDNELKGGNKWGRDTAGTSALNGGHGLYVQGNGMLTIQDEDKNGSLTAVGGDVETSDLQRDQRKHQMSFAGGDGIRARYLTVSGAEIKAEGGDCKVTGKSTMSSVGGDGIRGKGYGDWISSTKLLNGAHITATGGDAYAENNKESAGGTGIYIADNAVIEGVSISAAGGSANAKKIATSGSAMYISPRNVLSSEPEDYILSMKDSTLELTGGSAKSDERNAKLNPVLSVTDFKIAPTMKNLTITAVAGKGESSQKVMDNGILETKNYNMTLTEIGGNSTINLVGTKTGGVNAKDDTVVNLYVPKDETLNKSDSVDKISTGETGKVNIYENSTASKNNDGTITVKGDLTGIKKDDHNYKLETTVEPTCTTPGKRVYTCTTEGHKGETYEEAIEALGHHFVEGVCTRCGAPEQAAVESNSGSAAVTLTVTGAGAYETSMADGRYIIAVPAENAVLSGCLGNLKELKAQGVNTLVFRTQLRETALNIDSMLSLGVDDTLFTLTHSGESAELTVGGVAHNELLH